MTKLGPDAKELIRAVGVADGPSPLDRERVRRMLAVGLGTAAFATTTGARAAQWVLVGAGRWPFVIAKTVGIAQLAFYSGLGATVGAAIAASTMVPRATSSAAGTSNLEATAPPPLPPTTPPAPSDEAPVADPTAFRGVLEREAISTRPTMAKPPRDLSDSPTIEPPILSPVPLDSHPSASSPAESQPGTASDRSGLAEEMQLLRQAQRARADGRPDMALRILSEYRSRFPAGTMRSESLAAEVMCLCEVGRSSDAQTRAGELMKTDPTSPLVPRISRSCVRLPPP
jgi:hypothetical protein